MNDVTTMAGRKCRSASLARAGHWTAGALACLAITGAMAQPAQRPLLVSVTGAKPNLMLSLDNSGSMGGPFSDGYALTHDLSKNTPERFAAVRSSDFNTLYYNPRVTYRPRVDALGVPFPKDSNISSISNQDSVTYETDVYFDQSDWRGIWNDGSAFLKESSFPSFTVPSGWSPFYRMSGPQVLPKHLAYSQQKESRAAAFTYAICESWATDKADPSNGCKTPRLVNVKRSMSTPIELPSDHQRTDCTTGTLGRTTCTPDQEMDNIVNWYRFYSNRMRAIQTAIGQAFQSKSVTDGAIRVGYGSINWAFWETTLLPGTHTDTPAWARGVRPWARGSSNNEQFYRWLYANTPTAQTPLHNAFDMVARYYQANGSAVKENPWAVDPSMLASSSNPEMSCRRAYHVMLSDGAWTHKLTSATKHKGDNFDNRSGPHMPKGSASTASSSDFAYSPAGLAANRQAYVPYGSDATGGLADLAARDYWHVDLRPDLANDVSTRPGQPTYWQNIRTYTIGYQIVPSGLLLSDDTKLTFQSIDDYRAQYLAEASKPTQPTWPTGELTLGDQASDYAKRVDDFIQAGYTGGGRGMSVSSAEEVRAAIDSILADILNASGNDGGTGLSGNPDDAVAGLDGRIQYLVDYKSGDNSGNVTAKKLDARGNFVLLDKDADGQTLSPPSQEFWSARTKTPDHTDRRIFSVTGPRSGIEFKGRLDALPADLQTALRTGARAAQLPDDSGFVDYLRGKRLVLDKAGNLFRLRESSLGAIVNNAPVLLGEAQHQGYEATNSTVEGRNSYAAYRDRLAAAKGVLVVATNAGMVHALDAGNGQELAAFMPRRSMRGLLDQADTDANFRYLLDGPIHADDVYANGTWQQLLVGTGGRGEKLIYGLRMPIHADDSRTPAASDFLWETGPDQINTTQFAIGNMTHEARIGQTDAGQWVVILNSGYFNGYGDGSRHGLLVLDALTGAVVRTLPLPSGFSAGKGLGGVTVVRNAQKRIVAAYAGDAKGQLWRFDLRGAPLEWKVSYGKPLFQTPDQRPIYAAPAWQPHPKGGRMVVVATGKLIEESDESDVTRREGIFGIWDPTPRDRAEEAAGFETVRPDQLLEQSTIERTIGTQTVQDVTRHRINWSTHRGWKLMLGGHDPSTQGMRWPGERVIDQVRNLGSSVQVNSVILNRASKDENCELEGSPKNWGYVLNFLDGVAKPVFDINNDGVLDVAMVLLDTGGFARNIAVVGLVSPANMTPAQREQHQVASNKGEGNDQRTKCVGMPFAMAGVAGEAIMGRVTCTNGWSRMQYQLTQVPQ